MLYETLNMWVGATPSTPLGCLIAVLLIWLWTVRRHFRSAVDGLLDAVETLTTGSLSPPLPDGLPGPRGLPFLGYLPFVGQLPHVTLAALAARYGGKAFKLATGCRRYVVVSRIETVRELEKKYPQQLRGKPRTFTTEQMTLGAHNDLVQRWKRRRGYTDAGLKLIEKSTMGDTVGDEVGHLIDYLGQLSGSSGPTDVRHDLSLFVARIMYRVVYGRVPDAGALVQLTRLVDKMPDYTTMIGSLSWFDVLPFWRSVSPRRFARFVAFNRATAAFCRGEKQRSLASAAALEADAGDDFVPDGDRNYCSSLFEFFYAKLRRMSPAERRRFQMTDDILYDGLEDIVRAGTESTSLVAQWFLLYLAAFPDVQRRMQNELDEFDAGVDSSSEPLTANDLPRLTYCRAALAETCRFCCLNPFLKRELTDDIKMPEFDGSGARLPRGTVLLFNNWAINNDDRKWTQPEVFRPERFLTADGERLDEVKAAELYMPFGFGKRRCIGVDTGRVVCLLATVEIIRHFDVALPDDTRPDLEPVFGIGLAPKEYRVVFRPRSKRTV